MDSRDISSELLHTLLEEARKVYIDLRQVPKMALKLRSQSFDCKAVRSEMTSGEMMDFNEAEIHHQYLLLLGLAR